MAASTTNLVFRYELHQFVIPNVHSTGRLLRRGLYVNAEELKINGRIRVGKKFHSAVESEAVGILRISAKYAEGCQLMSSLRHPNIVQFIGLCFLPDFPLPVFVMEKPWTNLGSLLAEGIPLTTKLSILIDIARGLVYLHNHNPPIVHSQLHVESVLLDNDMVAKISDLEDTLISNLLSNKHRLYMSHLLEVLGNEACGPKCDIFSFGEVALFTIQYHPWVRDDLPHDFLGTLNAALSCYVAERGEIRRHYRYILEHSEGHPLVQLVEVCLSEEASCRPSADEVLQQLEAVLQAPCEYLTELDDFLRDTVDPKLPKRRSSAEDADLEAIPAEVAQHECPICFVALDDDLHVTTCGHRFCHACITRSLEQSHQCPICRRDLFMALQDPPNYTRRIHAGADAGNQQPPPRPRIQGQNQQPPPRPRIQGQNQQQPQPRTRRQERQQSLMDRIVKCLLLCVAVCLCPIGTIAPLWAIGLIVMGVHEDCPSNQSPITTTFQIYSYVMLFLLFCQLVVFRSAGKHDHLDNLDICTCFSVCTCIGCVVSVIASVPFLGLLIAETVHLAEESDAIFGGYYTDDQTVIPCELNMYSSPYSVVGAYVVFIPSNVVFGCFCVAFLCARL